MTNDDDITTPTSDDDTTGDASSEPPDADHDDGDWWSEDESEASPRPGGKISLRTWVVGGVGALLIAGAAVAGISAIGSSDSVATATAGNDAQGAIGAGQGMPGQGMPGQGMPGQGMPGAPGTAGTVSAIDGSRFTVKTSSGDSVEVTTTGDTTVVAEKSGSVPDIHEGDRVVVFGDGSSSELAARHITAGNADLLPAAPGGGQGGPPGARQDMADGGRGMPSGAGFPTVGVVKGVDGSTLKITTNDGGTVTVTTSSDTDVEILKASSVSDLKVGDEVRVMGTTSDGSVAATRIRVGALHRFPGGGAPGPRGGRPAPPNGADAPNGQDIPNGRGTGTSSGSSGNGSADSGASTV